MPYLTPVMRKAAPELSREMDELRKERKTLVERRCYVTTAGVEGGDAVQQRIADIDAKVTALYARAKEQLVTGIANDLTIGASTLRIATNESKAVRDFIAQETKRHSDAMLTLIALQEKSGATLRDAVKTIEGAAENLIYRWRRGAGNRARGRGCRCRELD